MASPAHRIHHERALGRLLHSLDEGRRAIDRLRPRALPLEDREGVLLELAKELSLLTRGADARAVANQFRGLVHVHAQSIQAFETQTVGEVFDRNPLRTVTPAGTPREKGDDDAQLAASDVGHALRSVLIAHRLWHDDITSKYPESSVGNEVEGLLQRLGHLRTQVADVDPGGASESVRARRHDLHQAMEDELHQWREKARAWADEVRRIRDETDHQVRRITEEALRHLPEDSARTAIQVIGRRPEGVDEILWARKSPEERERIVRSLLEDADSVSALFSHPVWTSHANNRIALAPAFAEEETDAAVSNEALGRHFVEAGNQNPEAWAEGMTALLRHLARPTQLPISRVGPWTEILGENGVRHRVANLTREASRRIKESPNPGRLASYVDEAMTLEDLVERPDGPDDEGAEWKGKVRPIARMLIESVNPEDLAAAFDWLRGWLDVDDPDRTPESVDVAIDHAQTLSGRIFEADTGERTNTSLRISDELRRAAFDFTVADVRSLAEMSSRGEGLNDVVAEVRTYTLEQAIEANPDLEPDADDVRAMLASERVPERIRALAFHQLLPRMRVEAREGREAPMRGASVAPS